MYRPIKLFLAIVLALALVVDFVPVPGNFGLLALSEAAAQEKKRRSLFSVLFGSRSVKRKTVRRKLKRKKVRRRVKARRKTTRKKPVKRVVVRRKAITKKVNRAAVRRKAVTPAAVAPVEVIEKLENAKRVLVIGDFIGGGLADGLDTALENNAAVEVVDKTKASSGLVRTDIVNWPQKLPELIAEVKPSYIVNLVGTNDRQVLGENGKRLKKRTPDWDAAYQGRIKNLATSLQQTGLPFVWIGVPPVRFKSMNNDFLVFNEWYRQAATSAGGKFVDVWDGFADAEGNYTRSGPDINGQIVLLRRKDGINLTPAGRRRLAFYVEGEVSKLLSGSLQFATRDDLSGVSIVVPEEDRYDPAKTGKTVVIRLNDPASDGADKLAGEVVDLSQQLGVSAAVPISVSARPRDGNSQRADNFSWPPAGTPARSSGAIARANQSISN